MARQVHYNQQIEPHFGNLSAPQAAQVIPAKEIRNDSLEILKAAIDTGQSALKAATDAYDRNTKNRIDAAVNTADERFEVWKRDYMKSNQGIDAINAQQAFIENYQRISKETLQEFGEPMFDADSYRKVLQDKLARRNLYAVRDGGMYEARQREAFEKTQFAGAMSQFEQLAGNELEDRSRVADKQNELLEMWKRQNPGLDPTAAEFEIRQKGEAAYLNGLLANERYDDVLRVTSGQGSMPATGQGEPVNMGQDIDPSIGRARTKGADPQAIAFCREAARHYGIPEELALAIMMQESGGRQNCMSPAGAYGILQLMPATAKDMKVDRNDMRQNAYGGLGYIARMYKRYGNWRLALMAYNWGPGNMDAWLKTGRGIKGQPMPKETREYVGRITGRLEGAKADAFLPEDITPEAIKKGSFNSKVEPDLNLSPERINHFRTKAEAGKRRIASELRAELDGPIKDYMAQCERGVVADCPIDAEKIYKAFGDEGLEVIRKLEDAQEFAINLSSLQSMSVEDMTRMLEANAPKPNEPDYQYKATKHDKLLRAVALVQKAWTEDAAGWLSMNDEKAASARAALLGNGFEGFNQENWQAYKVAMTGAMEQRGIGGALLSKQDAKAIAELLQTDDDLSGDRLRYMAQAFGTDTPAVIKAVLPEAGPMMRLLISGLPDGAIKVIQHANKDKDYVKDKRKQLGLSGEDGRQFDEYLRETLSPVLMTVFNSPGMGNALLDAVEKYALHKMAYGKDSDAAIEEAANEVILDKVTPVIDMADGLMFRCPNDVDAEQVSEGARRIREAADLSGFMLPGHRKGIDPEIENERWQDVIRQYGCWRNADDDSGLVLYFNSNPVQDKKGKQVKRTWAELQEEGSKGAKKVRSGNKDMSGQEKGSY